jgi:hypothetical protein
MNREKVARTSTSYIRTKVPNERIDSVFCRSIDLMNIIKVIEMPRQCNADSARQVLRRSYFLDNLALHRAELDLKLYDYPGFYVYASHWLLNGK